MSVPLVPRNTKKNNNWSLKNFYDWRDTRNKAHPDDKRPADFSFSRLGINKRLRISCLSSLAKHEIKKEVGTPQQLLLLCCLGCCAMFALRIPKLPIYGCLKPPVLWNAHHHGQVLSIITGGRGWSRGKTYQCYFKGGRNMLWEKGVLGIDTPESLLQAVFYYNGKCLCLRGGKEHRSS